MAATSGKRIGGRQRFQNLSDKVFDTVNDSRGGRTAAQAHRLLHDGAFDKHIKRYSFIAIMLGSNDYNSSVPADEQEMEGARVATELLIPMAQHFVTNRRSWLRRKNGKVILITPPPRRPSAKRRSHPEHHHETYHLFLRGLRSALDTKIPIELRRHRIKYRTIVKLYNPSMKPNNVPQLMAKDGIHMGAQGQKILQNTLNSMFFSDRSYRRTKNDKN